MALAFRIIRPHGIGPVYCHCIAPGVEIPGGSHVSSLHTWMVDLSKHGVKDTNAIYLSGADIAARRLLELFDLHVSFRRASRVLRDAGDRPTAVQRDFES